MKTANFPTIGTLDTTLPTPGDATYQMEALALVMHQIIKALSDNGFTFSQSETSDFTTFGNGVAGGLDNYITRYEELLATGASAVVASIPDVLPIIGALLSGGAEPVIAILVQGVLDTMLRHTDRRTDYNNGDAQDFTALVEKLDDLKEEMGVFNTKFDKFGLIDDTYSRLQDFPALVEKLDDLKEEMGVFNTKFDKFGLIDDTYSRLESFFSNLTLNLIKDEEESSFSFTDRVV